jgi:radical SAM superfamily enzyme YgiQ (UPF0313 family)
MKILLYNPDNGVTRNFMPHLWMFLLKAITPSPHEVLLIDGNARPMNEDELLQFILREQIGLVGIGAMTRMIARAYKMADRIRAVGIPVVMGGPHVTEVPDEALGKDGGVRHADAVALGEADQTWPLIVEDAAKGQLKEIYAPLDEKGVERKPSLQPYPEIPWETYDLEQFNMVPRFVQPLLKRYGSGWAAVRVIPMESGRGCPYGCEFCTVTGFFGDSIRFRTNESVVNEMLRLKRHARQSREQVIVFFIDDNFAINIKRTKSLLREIIAAGAQLPWIAQISANLLRDEELVDLIAASDGKWIFIGMESIDVANLADVNKNFNKPGEYRALSQIESWPPGLPVFGQLTPFPSTPLYKRLQESGRLTRPRHWLEFAPYQMAHTPLRMTIEETHRELEQAWAESYSAERIASALESIREESINNRVIHLVMRMFFRGIYYPQMTKRAWIRLIGQNRKVIMKLMWEAISLYRARRKGLAKSVEERAPLVPANEGGEIIREG